MRYIAICYHSNDDIIIHRPVEANSLEKAREFIESGSGYTHVDIMTADAFMRMAQAITAKG